MNDLPIHPKDWLRKTLDWFCDGREDYVVFRARKRTRRHRILRDRCKNVWILTGLAILLNPSPSFALTLTLVAALLSFAVLDETEGRP